MTFRKSEVEARCLIMKGKILIVEDHEMIAESYKLMLEAQGYDVFLTGNGQECIEKFDEHLKTHSAGQETGPFNLIVVDYHIPGKDGMEVIEHVLSKSPQQRVLIASSYPRDVIEKSAQSADILQNAIEMLPKPFDLEDFVDTIEGRRPSETISIHG